MSETAPPRGVPPRVGWALVWIASLALALTVANIGLQFNVQAARNTVSQRQAFINQTAAVGRIDTALVRALAVQAAEHHDAPITAMLAAAGVHYQLHPAPAAGTPTASPTASPGAAPGAAPATGTHP